MIPETYSFTRYLKAKKSVDDRALNRVVFDALRNAVSADPKNQPLRVCELGAGIGTMLTRMLDWGLFKHAEYTSIDKHLQNIEAAQNYLQGWADERSYHTRNRDGEVLITSNDTEVLVHLVAAEVEEFIESRPEANWDLLVANAFLDLVILPDSLEKMFQWGKEAFWFYFSINYDGLTILEPVIDEQFDQHVLALYNATMNKREVRGVHFGDHQTGRHLLSYIPMLGGSILSAGSSDWVVLPGPGGYSGDEAYFLHFIIHTIYAALKDHPNLNQKQFDHWIQLRHDQIESRKLVYIAHQLDIFGKNRTE